MEEQLCVLVTRHSGDAISTYTCRFYSKLLQSMMSMDVGQVTAARPSSATTLPRSHHRKRPMTSTVAAAADVADVAAADVADVAAAVAAGCGG